MSKKITRVNLDMTGAMAALPKTGSQSVVEYKPVISDVGADTNIDVEARFFSPKGTGKITLHEPAQQEPVAWMSEGGNFSFEPWQGSKPLYTTPPQRTWVGLTDEEIDKTHETKVWDARRSYARAIEAKLKEKNT